MTRGERIFIATMALLGAAGAVVFGLIGGPA